MSTSSHKGEIATHIISIPYPHSLVKRGGSQTRHAWAKSNISN